jgi:hypothetical protein
MTRTTVCRCGVVCGDWGVCRACVRLCLRLCARVTLREVVWRYYLERPRRAARICDWRFLNLEAWSRALLST